MKTGLKFIVDFEDKEDMLVSISLMRFIEKLEICQFDQLYNLEHWFSDIMIVEYAIGDPNNDNT